MVFAISIMLFQSCIRKDSNLIYETADTNLINFPLESIRVFFYILIEFEYKWNDYKTNWGKRSILFIKPYQDNVMSRSPVFITMAHYLNLYYPIRH